MFQFEKRILREGIVKACHMNSEEKATISAPNALSV